MKKRIKKIKKNDIFMYILSYYINDIFFVESIVFCHTNLLSSDLLLFLSLTSYIEQLKFHSFVEQTFFINFKEISRGNKVIQT